MVIKNFFYVLILLLTFLLSCDKKEKNESNVLLLLDEKNSFSELSGFALSRIEIIKEDTIYFKRYYGEELFQSDFFQYDNAIYEIRQRGWNADEILGIDSILTFSFKDTTFIYDSAYEFPSLVPYFGLVDCKYEIFQQDNYYVTKKQSLMDTTYQEIFFYDKDFNIFKFVNTYQNNICIYEAVSN